MKCEVIIGNIVKQPDVEAIVNSANANLRLGCGVAGAIHMAAGKRLEEYCKPFAPLALGAALLTPGFELPNPWVIHIRSAHYINDDEPEHHMTLAILAVLNTALENNIKRLAMPAVGTGVFKFPPQVAAKITAQCLQEFAKKECGLEFVRICVVSEDLRATYESALR